MKLRDDPVCVACPYEAIEPLQHFLLECKNIRGQSFQDIFHHMHLCMPCLNLTEFSPLYKLQFLIGDTCYYLNQECGDFFNRIGKSMLKRMHVFRLSAVNID